MRTWHSQDVFIKEDLDIVLPSVVYYWILSCINGNKCLSWIYSYSELKKAIHQNLNKLKFNTCSISEYMTKQQFQKYARVITAQRYSIECFPNWSKKHIITIIRQQKIPNQYFVLKFSKCDILFKRITFYFLEERLSTFFLSFYCSENIIFQLYSHFHHWLEKAIIFPVREGACSCHEHWMERH